ncbi:unnamed protein product, partial [Symbiodinium pilosum]
RWVKSTASRLVQQDPRLSIREKRRRQRRQPRSRRLLRKRPWRPSRRRRMSCKRRRSKISG